MIKILKPDEVKPFLEKYAGRSADTSEDVRQTVAKILANVRKAGDRALVEYTRQLDGVDLSASGFSIPMSEMADATNAISARMMEIIEEAAENIRSFHEKERPQSWLSWEEDGIVLGQRVTPMERVGLYVPGGRAVYPSSLLMTAIPAQVAGVKELVVVSPPDKQGRVHPSILAVVASLGISEVYKIGGAQAIGALAFGTKSIRRVDKIVGPGNLYVAEAKRQVYGIVDIDMIAGPSEVVILADSTANPAFIAADLLAQAEHDPAASAVCVTVDANVAKQVQAEVEKQTAQLKRRSIITESLKNWGGILPAKDMETAVALVNLLAPEHLGLHVRDPWETVKEISHAGAIFLGHHTPETVGDYWAGPNHVLPTNQTARFASPLGTQDFLKHSSLIAYPKAALADNADAITKFAELEGLDAHANAVRQRLG